jgi:Tol biopolymer transport system component
MSAQWEALDRIFREAQLVPAHEQAAFVERACGGDEMLRSDVVSLLSAGNSSASFMENSALDVLAKKFAADGSNLEPGRRIGVYTIQRKLGSGGAGEVWQATDERLGRNVAIKMLLPHWSTDKSSLHRFTDEARTVGTLNHPNILTVHDVGEHDGMPYLVSECLEGRNLRERLKSGTMSVNEAIAITLGIAQGLAAAHERGIVHRDLKPENTFLKSDGSVKLLDFGLAKLRQPASALQTAVEHSRLDAIAGTAGYMAPEQLGGASADPRADLFALGVIMYEMLAGKHPFRGTSDLETLKAILSREPEDLATAKPNVPPALALIVMRLLEKKPEARFQSARDLAWSVSQDAGAVATRRKTAAASPDRFGWRPFRVGLIAVVAIVAGILIGKRWPGGADPNGILAAPMMRFTWSLLPGQSFVSAPAVAPGGRHIAYVATGSKGARLFVRDLQSLDPREIPGSEGASQPFWSPDGKQLGFFAGGRMMKVSLPNGALTQITTVQFGRGGAWTRSGVIVFGPDLVLSGLNKVSADGGNAEPATLLDIAKGDTDHQFPVALPDGTHFLYFVRSTDDKRRGIYLGRVDRPAAHPESRLFYSESSAVYVPGTATGKADLVYLSNGRAEIRQLDLDKLAVAADARMLDFVPTDLTVFNPPMVSASPEVMVFADAIVRNGNLLASYSLDGKLLKRWESAEAHNWPRLSPDGRLLARQHIDKARAQPDIWVEDLERGTVYPVASTTMPDMSPVWSPDGRALAFVTGHLPGRPGELKLNLVAADGTGTLHSFDCPGEYCEPTDWSADGATLLVTSYEKGNQNVWTIPAGGGKAAPLLAADHTESDARFSPNGRWVAYVSREAGRPEVWVHSVSGTARRMVVSGKGGNQPVWRRDGKALYFVDLDGRLQRVDVNWSADRTPSFGLPVAPPIPRVGFGHWGTQFDISPDGSQIYFMQPDDAKPASNLQVVVNWRPLLDAARPD